MPNRAWLRAGMVLERHRAGGWVLGDLGVWETEMREKGKKPTEEKRGKRA